MPTTLLTLVRDDDTAASVAERRRAHAELWSQMAAARVQHVPTEFLDKVAGLFPDLPGPRLSAVR